MSDRIWIAFGCDGGFAPHVAATIASIIRRTPAREIQFLIMQVGFDEVQKEKLQAVAPDAQFTWVDMSSFELPDYHVSNHISYATLFRLGLERMAPADCRRLLYLDADLIVLGDVRELWHVDLKGAAIGAVPDAGLGTTAMEIDQHWETWVDDKDAPYLNAGVMLIDLDRVREESGFSKALGKIADHGLEMPYQDQDAINWIYWNAWTVLPLDWNVQRFQLIGKYQADLSPESLAAIRAPKIVHFTGPEKPWNMEGYHPWWWIYWDALADTNYLSEVRKTHGISRQNLFHIWSRWLKRRPLSAFLKGNFPNAIFKS